MQHRHSLSDAPIHITFFQVFPPSPLAKWPSFRAVVHAVEVTPTQYDVCGLHSVTVSGTAGAWAGWLRFPKWNRSMPLSIELRSRPPPLCLALTPTPKTLRGSCAPFCGPPRAPLLGDWRAGFCEEIHGLMPRRCVHIPDTKPALESFDSFSGVCTICFILICCAGWASELRHSDTPQVALHRRSVAGRSWRSGFDGIFANCHGPADECHPHLWLAHRSVRYCYRVTCRIV